MQITFYQDIDLAIFFLFFLITEFECNNPITFKGVLFPYKIFGKRIYFELGFSERFLPKIFERKVHFTFLVCSLITNNCYIVIKYYTVILTIKAKNCLDFNPLMMESKSVDWFLYDNGLHERVKLSSSC